MMELYSHPVSPASQKVRLVLAEKNIDYELHPVDLPAKENLDPWYLELNPMGVLPTLVVEGTPLVESSIICEYLDEAYPKLSLRPRDPVQLAQMRVWLKHIDERLHYAAGALVWTLLMRPGMLEKPIEERDTLLARIPDPTRRDRHRRWVEDGIDSQDLPDAVVTYRKTLADMENALQSGAWLMGDQFTLADVAMLPYFQCLQQFGWQGFYQGEYANVADWFDRGQARPSYDLAICNTYSEQMNQNFSALGEPAWEKINKFIVAGGS
jgi:glutathione S-transferase